MPTPTYTPLANVTLASNALSVEITGISQDFRDLILVLNGTSTAAGANLRLFFNNDSGANYNYVVMYGTGSGSGSTFYGSGNEFGTFYSSLSTSVLQIMDYSATNKHKTTLTRANNASNLAMAECTRWANTSAITSININFSSGDLGSGTTVALYGIAA